MTVSIVCHGTRDNTRARFLSLARSQLRLCSASHRSGYFSNLACDWLNIVWAYSEQQTENAPSFLYHRIPPIRYQKSAFGTCIVLSDSVECMCVCTIMKIGFIRWHTKVKKCLRNANLGILLCNPGVRKCHAKCGSAYNIAHQDHRGQTLPVLCGEQQTFEPH